MFAKATSIYVVVGMLVATAALPSAATASEWGCEVLLCASSSNPSWRGVPACHPPMNRLISAMKKPGFDWPTCPEGGTGKPGYQRYAECPGGYQVGSSRDRNGFAGSGDLCVKTVNVCQGNTHGLYNSDRQRSCIQTVSISDRSGQSLTSSTSKMTVLAKPSGIGLSCTNRRFRAVKEGLNPCEV